MVRNLWGTNTFIPLLKEIWLLMTKYDVRLTPTRIDTKANIVSDALSRHDWTTFATSGGLGPAMANALARNDVAAQQALRHAYLMEGTVISDFDDWQLVWSHFESIDLHYGPFDVDATVDQHRTNSQCRTSWNRDDDALTKDWSGLNVYCNPPYSDILPFLKKGLTAKLADPLASAAVYIVPVWQGYRFWDLITSYPFLFQVVHRFPVGSKLFTSPNRAGPQRKFVGPTRWMVAVIRVPLGACAQPDYVRGALDF